MTRSRNSKNYWASSLVFILTFGIVEGLRWGRMTDWNNLYIHFLDIGADKGEKTYEFIVTYLFKLFYGLEIPFWFFIFLQCIFLAYSCCLILKNYNKIAFWALPVLLYIMQTNENFIRWYFGLSFVFCALHFLEKKNYILVSIFLLCSILTHTGTSIFILLVLLKNVLSKVNVNRYVIAILFIAFNFLMSIHDMWIIVVISDFLLQVGLIDPNSFLGIYLSNSEDLIHGNGAAMLGVSEVRFSSRILECLKYLPVIFMAPKYVQNYKFGFFYYNLFIIGAILNPVLSTVEILSRISRAFLLFYGIVAGLVFYNVHKDKTVSNMKKVICLVSFSAAVWPSFSLIWQTTEIDDMNFIWDSEGRDYNPNR